MPTPSSFWPQWSEQPVFFSLVTALLVSGVFLMVAQGYQGLQNAQHAGYGDQMPPSISVSAEGKAVMKNDIATVDVGVTKTAANASDAQTQATEAMNALTAAIKTLGIKADDLQTSSYTVYPQYDYDKSPAVIVGYEASQTLTVKIRDSALVGAVLGKATDFGATNVGSLRFETDDTTVAENEAREKAIAKARTQAEAIASAMGARLGAVVSYSENVGGMPQPYYGMMAKEAFLSDSLSSAAPDVQMGQSDVLLNVYVNYALE